MATKISRTTYTPKAFKSSPTTSQTIRLLTSENKRLKRAARKERMTFNKWAVRILNDAADGVLNPKPQGDTN
jgi:hypothetical protein